ncbi:hypothetical protein LPJ61_000778, partial [Coemansia biformis]
MTNADQTRCTKRAPGSHGSPGPCAPAAAETALTTVADSHAQRPPAAVAWRDVHGDNGGPCTAPASAALPADGTQAAVRPCAADSDESGAEAGKTTRAPSSGTTAAASSTSTGAGLVGAADGTLTPPDTAGDHDAGNDKDDDDDGGGAQRRRLNQACLLCRRKKIRCDSGHPSCSNCQRRGIQCIYPEVRKRGRPPRMYTFADFALPGQPLPPELRGLADVHASAMLPTTGSQDPPLGEPVAAAHGAAGMMRAWLPGAPEVSGGYARRARSPGSANDVSTPACGAPGERGRPPVLPPIAVAIGQGGLPGHHHAIAGGLLDPAMAPTPLLAVDQAVLDLFEHVTPSLPIIHRQTLVQSIRDRSLTLPLWLAIHAVSARFEAHHGGKYAHAQHPAILGHRPGCTAAGAGYAEKAHALLTRRLGRPMPLAWARCEHGRNSVAHDRSREPDEPGSGISQREAIEQLQSLMLLSIHYAGNSEPELAAEAHAAAVRFAQRMGVHRLDDLSTLQGTSSMASPTAAQRHHQNTRAAAAWGTAPPPGAPSSTAADLRRDCIELETLRRLWWSMFILDRAYCVSTGCPRMIHVSSFRVRLPCSDLEWDAMHAQPTAGVCAARSSQPAGLMLRTFGEAVMHTSLAEQATNEIAATPSADPDIYRYAAALAGLIDSVLDLEDDVRALTTAPIQEGTDILTQLRAEQMGAGPGGAGGLGSGLGRPARGWYYAPPPAASASSSSHYGPMIQQTPASAWLGAHGAHGRFAGAGRGGWSCPAAGSVWPPDWRSRMRVLKERIAALESRLTEWYSSMPIARLAQRPHCYEQLPLQDRITHVHQQIVYFGSVIQLQSLVIATQGLLLPGAVDDEPPPPADHAARQGRCAGAGRVPSALASMMWRSLMDMGVGLGAKSGLQAIGSMGDSSGSVPGYAPQSGRGPHRACGLNGGAPEAGGSYGDPLSGGLGASAGPLDENGDGPEIIRDELAHMVHAAWRRCTEAAAAMSAVARRAAGARRATSGNHIAPYHDPTFRPQVLPPYRGDVPTHQGADGSHDGSGGLSRLERAPSVAGMRAPPHQRLSADLPGQGPLEMPGQLHYQLFSPPIARIHPRSPSSRSSGVPSMEGLSDAGPGPGPVVDGAALFMQLGTFTCAAAYIGACIHLSNQHIIPRWEEALQGCGEEAAKAHGHSTDPGMPPRLDDSRALPPPPCTVDQAREGAKPLETILDGMSSFWK